MILESSIDVIVTIINFMEDRFGPNGKGAGERVPMYAGFLSSSPLKALWLYQSCSSFGCGADESSTGWPSYVIDSSAVRSRAMAWFSYRYAARGEFYYETTQAYYNGDPWVDQRAYGGTGDGTLFYPGTVARIGGRTDIPLASIRLKMIRESYEDYEYLKMLSDLGGAREAAPIALALFPHPWEAEQSPEALMSAREALAEKILLRQSERAGGCACLMGDKVPYALGVLLGLLALRLRRFALGPRRGSS